MKKHRGSIVEDALMVLLGILCCFIVIYSFLMVVEIANYKEDVKELTRARLLEMETVGYLSPEGANSFRQELTDIGVLNVDISGTTMSSVGYGQPIYISLKGKLPVKALNTSSGDLLNYVFEDAAFDINITMKSTAKH